ncbi:MAG: tRNA (adenosine(37)-N6)-dimethylallyltransferase MiaA [Oscillospiraceae bacterium]|nr:tRNA (adenosine(37)-N6)-dimethylallyltransferase MiaA [Oscillospiraceae bacterium]
MDKKIKIICIVGPTCSGKTNLGIDIAKNINGEIISADSMQIYRGMDISTAKPSIEELKMVKHHMIDFLDIKQRYSVSQYVKEASIIIDKIVKKGKIPILVGGTGLYIDSLTNGINFLEYDKKCIDKVKYIDELYFKYGINPIIEELVKCDKKVLETIHINNHIKLINALKKYKLTGITFEENNIKSLEKEPIYNPLFIGLNYETRDLLYYQINNRVDNMITRGVIEESLAIYNQYKNTEFLNNIKTIGCKEFFPFFKKEQCLLECIENIKKQTRRYSKRQLTWYRYNTNINWYITKKTDLKVVDYIKSKKNIEQFMKI